jgi:hypothetical protein
VIADVIKAILGNLSVVFCVVAVVVAYVKWRAGAASTSGQTFASILWAYLVFYAVGLGLIWFGILHAFFGEMTVRFIGWEPSPFEWELAWGEIGLGVVAIMSLWRGTEMRLAATIMFVIFSLGAAFQHIHQIVCCANYAPGNAGVTLWFSDIALPIALVIVAILAGRPERATASSV